MSATPGSVLISLVHRWISGTFSTSELVALVIIAGCCCGMIGIALRQTLEYRRKYGARFMPVSARKDFKLGHYPTPVTCHHLHLKLWLVGETVFYKCEACGANFEEPEPYVIEVVEPTAKV